MIRVYHIEDPALKERVVKKLAEWRGCEPWQIPEWFEIDDADFSEILIELRAEDEDSPQSRRARGEYD
ncbi:MAG: hypothetical protein QM770_06290 [Tepidisphaeraceae bacterium]